MINCDYKHKEYILSRDGIIIARLSFQEAREVYELYREECVKEDICAELQMRELADEDVDKIYEIFVKHEDCNISHNEQINNAISYYYQG